MGFPTDDILVALLAIFKSHGLCMGVSYSYLFAMSNTFSCKFCVLYNVIPIETGRGERACAG